MVRDRAHISRDARKKSTSIAPQTPAVVAAHAAWDELSAHHELFSRLAQLKYEAGLLRHPAAHPAPTKAEFFKFAASSLPLLTEELRDELVSQTTYVPELQRDVSLFV
jgi:hypothetical protein